MSQPIEQITYHSTLHRHIHSILPHEEHSQYQRIYSSNTQPPLPTILSKSRSKQKPQQKSLKKGISRVTKSKSKLDVQQQNKTKQNKQLKGTLLNFNTQQVIQSKYHLFKPKDQILQRTGQRHQRSIVSSRYRSGQKQRYDSRQRQGTEQYRFTTYIPGIQGEEQKYSVSRNINMQNKENNLNQSNRRQRNPHRHTKNESQSIQIVNPTSDNILQLATWRTTQNFDQFYSHNFRTDQNYNFNLNSTNPIQFNNSQKFESQHNKKYSSLIDGNKISRMGIQQTDEQKIKLMDENNQLKEKIKHLQHEIVESQKQKSFLKEENQKLKIENNQLTMKNQKLKEERFLSSKQLEKEQEPTLQQNKSRKKLTVISPHVQKNSYHEITQDIKPHSSLFCSNSNFQQLEQEMRQQIEQLERLNQKLTKELQHKTIQLDQFTKKNKQLTQKVTQYLRQTKKYQQKVQSQEEKLYRNDSRINELSQQIEKVKLQNSKLKQKSFRSQALQSSYNQVNKKSYNSLDKTYEQKIQQNTIIIKRLQQELDLTKCKYEQLTREYAHLQKKNLFMKDQLQHVKYLQHNNSSGGLSHRSNYGSLDRTVQKSPLNNKNNQKAAQDNNLIIIRQLQNKLQSLQITLSQTQQQYSNLKQNFRALQQLYIKQQDQIDVLEQENKKIYSENSKLRIQLSNLEQISNAKRLALKQENECSQIKLLQKQEAFVRLNKQYSLLQRKNEQLSKEINQLHRQKDQLNEKYITQVEKLNIIIKKHKEEIQFIQRNVRQEQQYKVTKICQKYEDVIDKLKLEISLKQEEIIRIKSMHIQEIKKLETQFDFTVEKFMNQKKEFVDQNNATTNKLRRGDNYHTSEKQNHMRKSHSNSKYNAPYLNKSRISNGPLFEININYQSMSRKQLQALASSLHEQFQILQNKYKTILIENQTLNESVKQNNRLLAHLEQQISYFKQNKENSTKEKLDLRQEVEKINSMMIQFKKLNAGLEEENKFYKVQLKDIEDKQSKYTKENSQLINQIKAIKQVLISKQVLLNQYQRDLKDIKLSYGQEKQFNQKLARQITIVKQQRQSHKSKQEYFKMLFQKTQKQLQIQLIQKAQLLKQKTLLMKKQESPVKRSLSFSSGSKFNPQNNRQTQLYRLQIYKDFNKLLNLSSQLYTLEQILQKNEQSYLKKLYETVKQQLVKSTELKALIVEMEQSFKKQKVHIKADYDVVYEKYLKYKSMCQSMQKDLEKYKSMLKRKDDKFVGIVI